MLRVRDGLQMYMKKREGERERQHVEVREIKLNKKVITHLSVPLYYWNGTVANAKLI